MDVACEGAYFRRRPRDPGLKEPLCSRSHCFCKATEAGRETEPWTAGPDTAAAIYLKMLPKQRFSRHIEERISCLSAHFNPTVSAA
jgi:hypothetical protein